MGGDDSEDRKSRRRKRRRSEESQDEPEEEERTRRRRRRRRSSDNDVQSQRERRRSMDDDGETASAADMDFERFRSRLAKIFFRPEDLIPHGSDEYRDFWKFLRKYQAFERQKGASGTGRRRREEPVFPSAMSSSSTTWSLPPTPYDPAHSQCFHLQPDDPRDLLGRVPFRDDSDDDESGRLTEAMVAKFQHVLTLYLNFLQQEKLSKLRQLRRAQAQLPIAEYKDEILSRLRAHQLLVIAGDTGCGKSTQVPQYLLSAGYGRVACTQPRRIACVSLAKRVGYETLNEYGAQIGYQIRFEKRKTAKTRVLFLTEGLLLRQVSGDASLADYDVIVLDEVHERHLHGDFLLGVVKCLAQQRPDLKVILMSATINIKLFQDYFNDEAPVIQVPGRLFPIKVQYHPIPSVEKSSASEKLNPAPYVRILQLIDQKYPSKERGDLLIFMSGLREITSVADACQEYAERNRRWIVLPLHSSLSLSEQDRVFDYAPDGVRKCIVSTNIAETSVTIDGVRFVVDSGKVKEMQYDAVTKMQRLKEFWISRASAEQRKGRSGRTGPGVCFRLYAEADYAALAPYSTPEIQRVPLDNLVLQMISMGLPDARKFPFIEPPPAESLENSILSLKEQAALNDDESLTITGRMLARLPVDVTIGKMLIMGTLFHQVETVLSLAAALSVQSPFTNNAFRDADCVAARRNLDSDHGDPITLLNAFREWLQVKSEQREPSRRWCKKRGLEEQRFYEMTKLRTQFKELLEQANLLKRDDDDASIMLNGEGPSRIRGSLSHLSSSERARRHGELKQLREQKRDYLRNEDGAKRKKFLRVRADGTSGVDDDEERVDLKDIEFRMRHDGKKVRDLLEGTKAYSYKDLTLLKLILTSGLYPQLAIGDEFNHAKSGADQLFHTRVKPFNVLHPNCIFASMPDYIALESMDTVAVAGFPAKYPVSAKHQLLVYLSLLETNKPYVTNALRMPALQTLLLFSCCVDTDVAFSRLVFDAWLEVRFADAEQGQQLVLTAARLRHYWQRLLQLRLQDTTDSATVAVADRQRELEVKLSCGLVDFVHTETLFSIRRLLPADVKVLYMGPGAGHLSVEENPFASDDDDDEGEESVAFEIKAHDKKGGLWLADFLVYNCLESSGDTLSSLANDWTCPLCQQDLYCGPLQKMTHYAKCSRKERDEKDAKVRKQEEAKETERRQRDNPLGREYFCQVCDKTLRLSSTEILRHKKSH